MTRKYTPPGPPTRVVAAHLPPHLYQYVQGLAQIQNASVSSTLVGIVQEHFNQAAQKVAKRNKR